MEKEPFKASGTAIVVGHILSAIPGGLGFFFLLSVYFDIENKNYADAVLHVFIGWLMIKTAIGTMKAFQDISAKLKSEEDNEAEDKGN